MSAFPSHGVFISYWREDAGPYARLLKELVDGAGVPRRHQLPADLHKLARLNALAMSYDRFEYDETRLTTVIQRVLASADG